MRKMLLLTKTIFISGALLAQDTTAPETEEKGALQINGSVDAYYRFNFNHAKSVQQANNFTSFTNSHNSFELGMASLKASYTKGKAGVVVDLGFGTRAREFSYNETGVTQAIKQAYITYAPSEHVKLSAGKWGTHVGYELLDPQLNRNYSMSYMFSYGPFSHTGLKADFTVGDGFGIMAGVTNPTDYLSAPWNKKFIIGQFSKTSEKVNLYLNYVGGKDTAEVASNQLGLTATAKITDKFSLGYDGTVKFVKSPDVSSQSWWGSALYVNVDPSEKFGITLRGEYFDDKKGVITNADGSALLGTSVIQGTLSFNIKPVSGLMIIPEFRLDSAKDPIFTKNSGDGTKSTGTFLLAAVYSF
ncbi:porin [Niabella sp. CC-SYL272]|uniref:porin n=1 Tax=Niabella agricola TaxID=2891571 RepID=UPI001F208C4C|nr:porin [Niabella agricola]MCF3111525.1 porin [Niabella agricola]